MSITVSEKQLKINGIEVATVHSDKALNELVKSLCENLSRSSAATLVLSFLGTATTAEVAELLNMDRSNTFRYLSTLAEEGAVKIVSDGHKSGTRGRPTHIWELS